MLTRSRPRASNGNQETRANRRKETVETPWGRGGTDENHLCAYQRQWMERICLLQVWQFTCGYMVGEGWLWHNRYIAGYKLWLHRLNRWSDWTKLSRWLTRWTSWEIRWWWIGIFSDELVFLVWQETSCSKRDRGWLVACYCFGRHRTWPTDNTWLFFIGSVPSPPYLFRHLHIYFSKQKVTSFLAKLLQVFDTSNAWKYAFYFIIILRVITILLIWY